MLRMLVAVITCLLAVTRPAAAAPRYEEDARARNAKAEFVYYAKATQAAAERSLGADLMAQRARADRLASEKKRIAGELAAARADVRSSRRRIEDLQFQVDKAATEVAAAQNAYAESLAKRDSEYAQELAVFRTAADNILATPDGLRILELFNQGDWATVKQMEVPLRVARQKMRNISAAADARAFATMALDQRDKGRETIDNVRARYEEIIRLDDSNFSDHFILSRLYMTTVQYDKAAAAAEKAANLTNSPFVKIYSYQIMSMARFQTGDAAGSIDIAQKAATLASGLPIGADDTTDLLHFKGTMVLASAYLYNGDIANAAKQFTKVFLPLSRLSEASPDRLDLAMLLYDCQNSMGEMLKRAGNHELALDFHKSSLQTLIKLNQAAPQSSSIMMLLAGTVAAIADEQAAMKSFDEAISTYELGISLLGNVPPESIGPISILAMSRLKSGLGNAHIAKGEREKGEGLLEEGRQLLMRVPPEYRDLQ